VCTCVKGHSADGGNDRADDLVQVTMWASQRVLSLVCDLGVALREQAARG
jgi:hypothetical protein